MRKLIVAAVAAAALVVSPSAAAVADTAEARVRIDAVDLTGVGVPEVTFTVTSSLEAATITTDKWGHATATLDIAPGETIVSDSTDPRVRAARVEYPDAEDGDRFRSQAVVAIAQGYEVAWAQSDLDGDTSYDTVWHQARVGSSDRWVIDLTTGPVRVERFAPYTVVSIFTANFTVDPANELVAIEQLPSGEYRAWVYSEVAGSLLRIDLGAMPTLWWLQDDFDGDGLRDILFYSDGSDGAYHFTLALSSTQKALTFSAGSPGALFYEESQDVTGDGIHDVVLGEGILGDTTRWWVWESGDRTVHTVDVGTIGGQPSAEGFNDGDADGLLEFVTVSDVEGSTSGERLWEVYEYASGDYFAVVLGPEDDRGPSPQHYPPSWF